MSRIKPARKVMIKEFRSFCRENGDTKKLYKRSRKYVEDRKNTKDNNFEHDDFIAEKILRMCNE